MTDLHPDLIELELLHTQEAPDDVARHVAGCAHCQAQLAFLDQLRAAQGSPPPLPLSAARRNMLVELAQDSARRVRATRRTPRGVARVLRWAAPVAAAAGLVLAIAVPVTLRQAGEAPAPALAGDLDGDAQITIVDALLLARALERGDTPEARHDLDGDRRVSGSDVEQIARLAVRLHPGGH